MLILHHFPISFTIDMLKIMAEVSDSSGNFRNKINIHWNELSSADLQDYQKRTEE